MSRRLKDSSNGESLTADPVTAHTLAEPRTPPGYHFDVDSSEDCLIDAFNRNPRAFYTSTLLEVTLAEIRKRREARADAVCYPQDSTLSSDGQVVNKLA